jgi:hypothetical protein
MSSFWSECENKEIRHFYDSHWGKASRLPPAFCLNVSPAERSNFMALHECLHDSFPDHYAAPGKYDDVVSPIENLPTYFVPANLSGRASCTVVEFTEHLHLRTYMGNVRRYVRENDGYLLGVFGSKGIGEVDVLSFSLTS